MNSNPDLSSVLFLYVSLYQGTQTAPLRRPWCLLLTLPSQCVNFRLRPFWAVFGFEFGETTSVVSVQTSGIPCTVYRIITPKLLLKPYIIGTIIMINQLAFMDTPLKWNPRLWLCTSMSIATLPKSLHVVVEPGPQWVEYVWFPALIGNLIWTIWVVNGGWRVRVSEGSLPLACFI